MNFDSIFSNILYGLSGFLFALYAVRYGIRSSDKIKRTYEEFGFSSHFILACLPSFIFFLFSLVLFPILFYTRTPIGGFIYLATYIFFNMKARQHR